MLSFVERTAVVAGVQRLFALSTTTMQWFTERGFVEVRARLRIHAFSRIQSSARDQRASPITPLRRRWASTRCPRIARRSTTPSVTRRST